MRKYHWRFPSFPPICIAIVISVLVFADTISHTRATDSFTTAQRQFYEGDWLAAADAAAELEIADGYALAAQAVLTYGATIYDVDEQHRSVDRAIAFVERAFEIEPDNVNAHIQAAAAYGFRAQLMRDVGDAKVSRYHIDRALFLAPNNPYAWAALGYWHGRTVLGAGSFIARLMFDAKRSAAIDAFERALEQAPDNAAIRIGFGRMLLRFDKEELADRGFYELRQVTALQSPRNALEEILFAHAHRLLDAYEKGVSQKDLRHMADAMAPYSRSAQ